MPRTYYPRCGVIFDLLLEDFGSGATGAVHTLEVVPREVAITRNDHRTADTCRIEVDFKDFPFDPRTIRSARVRVLLGDLAQPDRELAADEDKVRAFIGFVDVPETRLSDAGESVTIECRDFTSVFLDHRWTESIDLTGPLTAVIERFVGSVPGCDGLLVGYSDGTSTLVLADALGKTRWAPQANDDAWTVLVDLLGRVGLIPVFEGDLLLILTARDFGVDRRTFLATNAFSAPRAAFLYGSNLTRLEFRRNLNLGRTHQVKVVAWDEATRTSREVLYPTEPTVTKRRVTTSGKVTNTTAPIRPFYVSGAYTEAGLRELAERIYTESARLEVEGTLETREMVDLEHGQALPLLGNGARVTVALGTSLLSNIAGLSEGEATRLLVANGVQTSVASALVAAFKRANRLAVEFYARRVVHHWHRDDGYRLELDFINYVGGPA